MSTMTETLEREEALFIPSLNGVKDRDEYVPRVAGEYLGHITDTMAITREFQQEGRTVKARIFNFKVRVAQENSMSTYTTTNQDGSTREITGEHFIGWTMLAHGVFRFLEPSEGDHFESNAEGNKRFLYFCQSLGMDIKTEKRTVNGKTLDVQVLPNINEDHLNGTPVIAVVGRGKDWVTDEGETRPSWTCKFTKRWESGKRLAATTTRDIEKNDLPF